MSTPFPPDRAAGRAAVETAVRCAPHETAVRLELMAAGFTRAERDAFVSAWDKPDEDLTLDEVVLLDRHYGWAARDWGVAS